MLENEISMQENAARAAKAANERSAEKLVNCDNQRISALTINDLVKCGEIYLTNRLTHFSTELFNSKNNIYQIILQDLELLLKVKIHLIVYNQIIQEIATDKNLMHKTAFENISKKQIYKICHFDKVTSAESAESIKNKKECYEKFGVLDYIDNPHVNKIMDKIVPLIYDDFTKNTNMIMKEQNCYLLTKLDSIIQSFLNKLFPKT